MLISPEHSSTHWGLTEEAHSVTPVRMNCQADIESPPNFLEWQVHETLVEFPRPLTGHLPNVKPHYKELWQHPERNQGCAEYPFGCTLAGALYRDTRCSNGRPSPFGGPIQAENVGTREQNQAH